MVFPDPVSPQTMITWLSRMAFTSRSPCSLTAAPALAQKAESGCGILQNLSALLLVPLVFGLFHDPPGGFLKGPLGRHLTSAVYRRALRLLFLCGLLCCRTARLHFLHGRFFGLPGLFELIRFLRGLRLCR